MLILALIAIECRLNLWCVPDNVTTWQLQSWQGLPGWHLSLEEESELHLRNKFHKILQQSPCLLLLPNLSCNELPLDDYLWSNCMISSNTAYILWHNSLIGLNLSPLLMSLCTSCLSFLCAYCLLGCISPHLISSHNGWLHLPLMIPVYESFLFLSLFFLNQLSLSTDQKNIQTHLHFHTWL